ncbi:hypothetical protein UPYG_G00340820 [Umbra pygmaea]|uniref:UPAR/Ly6 domain-containing protein n=1 Tax=Umbra pygmaea TaxID=75934 RepID=A0ABD0VY25_UMBPY
MNKIIYGILSLVALFMLAESLTCNQCSVGLLGFCVSPSTSVCSTNTSSCFTGKATFPSISSSIGFNSQGCLESNLCNVTNTNNSILSVSYTTVTQCCSVDKCNPTKFNSATSAKLSVTAALCATLMATAWSSIFH